MPAKFIVTFGSIESLTSTTVAETVLKRLVASHQDRDPHILKVYEIPTMDDGDEPLDVVARKTVERAKRGLQNNPTALLSYHVTHLSHYILEKNGQREERGPLFIVACVAKIACVSVAFFDLSEKVTDLSRAWHRQITDSIAREQWPSKDQEPPASITDQVKIVMNLVVDSILDLLLPYLNLKRTALVVIEQDSRRLIKVPLGRIRKHFKREFPKGTNVSVSVVPNLSESGESILVAAQKTVDRAYETLRQNPPSLLCVYTKRLSGYSVGEIGEQERCIPVILTAVVGKTGETMALICFTLGEDGGSKVTEVDALRLTGVFDVLEMGTSHLFEGKVPPDVIAVGLTMAKIVYDATVMNKSNTASTLFVKSASSQQTKN